MYEQPQNPTLNLGICKRLSDSFLIRPAVH